MQNMWYSGEYGPTSLLSTKFNKITLLSAVLLSPYSRPVPSLYPYLLAITRCTGRNYNGMLCPVLEHARALALLSIGREVALRTASRVSYRL